MTHSSGRGFTGTGFVDALRTLALLALFLASRTARANEPWDAGPFLTPPATLLAVASSKPAPKSAVEVLLEQYEYHLEASGPVSIRYRSVYRILDAKAARGWSKVSVSWRPGWQTRPTLSARVITPDGLEHRLDPTTVAEGGDENDGDTYGSDRSLTAPLPSIVDDVVVETMVDLKQERLLLSGVFGRRVWLQDWFAKRAVEIRLTMPRELSFSHVVENSSVVPEVHETEGQRVIFLRAGPFAEVSPEQREPAMARGSFPFATYSFGTGGSWQSLARRFRELIDAQIAKTPMATTAHEVVGDAKSPLEAAQRIAKWMRPFRYASLSMGDGGWIPRTPGETVARRYGDCKDFATLAIALLRASGWEAWSVLVSVSGPDQPDAVPSLAAFDHELVKVGGPTPFYWDLTQPELPPGELRWDDGGRKALVLAPTTTALVPLPSAGSQRTGYEVVTELRFAETGFGDVTETTRRSGESAGGEHTSTTNLGARRKSAERRLKSIYQAGDLVRFEESGREPGEVFQRIIAARDAKTLQTDGDTATVAVSPLNPFSAISEELLRDESAPGAVPRKYPLEFMPGVVTGRTRIAPLAGFVARGRRPPERVQLGPAVFTSEESVLPDGSVEVVDRLDLVKSRYSAAEVSAFRRAYNELRRGSDRSVGFDSELSRLLDSGDTDRAVRRGEALVQAAPKNPFHRARLSRALLASGFTLKAREVARQVTRDAPDSPPGWEALGYALLTGTRGSALEPAADVPGAVEAFRKLRSLADTPRNSLLLALVYEFGPDGDRFGRGARLDDAVGELKHLRDELHDNSSDEELLWALFRVGKDAEVLALAPRVASGARRNAEWVASLALRASVQDAQEQVRRFNLDETERRSLLESASEELTARGEFAPAAELFARAAVGQDGENVRIRLVRLQRLRDCAVRRPTADDPGSVVRKALYPTTASSLEAVLASSLDESARTRLREQPFHVRENSGFDTVPEDVVAEMLWCFTRAEVTKTGDGAWEVRGASPWTGADTRWVVVRETGTLRLKEVSPTSSKDVSEDTIREIWAAAARGERGPETERLLQALDARRKDTPLPLLEAYAVLSASHGATWKARQLLEEMVRRRNALALTPAEWLVRGLLAERHGLETDARAALAKARAGAPSDERVAMFLHERGRRGATLALESAPKTVPSR